MAETIENLWPKSLRDGDIKLQKIVAGGHDFDVAEAGEGRRLALLLHGFPELNLSWRHQFAPLVAAGWRVWAPNLRGYGTSYRPRGVSHYHLDHLTKDIAALIDVSGAEEVMLIAHDWGGFVAWDFAIRRLRPISRLITMNAPHPHMFAREARQKEQRRKSWYIYFFQLPWIPEWRLGRHNGAVIRRIFQGMAANKNRFPPELLDAYAAAAQRPGALTAMVNYYRAAARNWRRFTRYDDPVTVPTLMIWGEADSALGLGCLDGTEDLVPDLTICRLPGISHWVQQDAPQQVNRIMMDWLAPKSAPH